MNCIMCDNVVVKGFVIRPFDQWNDLHTLPYKKLDTDGQLAECIKCPSCGHSELRELILP